MCFGIDIFYSRHEEVVLMLKNLFFLLCLFVVPALGTAAQPLNPQEVLERATVQIVGVSDFRGDRHGDFAGDLVAHLSDGSQWKVHPTQVEEFSNWQLGDYVHLEVRTSFYWFKREHKFSLYNHSNGDSLKVMLIRLDDYPLWIDYASSPYPTSTYQRPIYHSYTYVDQYGRTITEHQLVGYETVPCSYRKDLFLNDGTYFSIDEKFKDFNKGRELYMGVNVSDGSYRPFIIIGTQREAKWVWIQ